jgi:hypothetical protein
MQQKKKKETEDWWRLKVRNKEFLAEFQIDFPQICKISIWTGCVQFDTKYMQKGFENKGGDAVVNVAIPMARKL